jgi:hypothetical protein
MAERRTKFEPVSPAVPLAFDSKGNLHSIRASSQ